jgi:hypothetical protein
MKAKSFDMKLEFASQPSFRDDADSGGGCHQMDIDRQKINTFVCCCVFTQSAAKNKQAISNGIRNQKPEGCSMREPHDGLHCAQSYD